MNIKDTSGIGYRDYLEGKYLPGRNYYLRHFFYPKIVRQFKSGSIIDLGCGTGAFLEFLIDSGRVISGIDCNSYFVDLCRTKGLPVYFDNLTELATVDMPVENALCDNVLEHLSAEDIDRFFAIMTGKCAPGAVMIVIVPGRRGFCSDPTHKTYVDGELIRSLCDKHGLELQKSFFHPLNNAWAGKVSFLNMQVFRILF